MNLNISDSVVLEKIFQDFSYTNFSYSKYIYKCTSDLNNILSCIKHNRIRQQARSLYKPSPIRYKLFLSVAVTNAQVIFLLWPLLTTTSTGP
jgi:hypothetical protein